MMNERALPTWELITDVALELPPIEQAAEIVGLAARLVGLRSRINDLDALDDFAVMLMREIEQATAAGTFCYHYQPIVSATSGALQGYEALLRWSRDGEAVAPALFLPIAEETGAIRTIQQRLLDQVATVSARLPPPAFISLNWSPRQLLKASAASALIDRIKELSLDPRRMLIEITPRPAIVDPELVYLCILLLKDTGIQIALDDFGGHHGSLAWLGRLPIDFVKLDPALIAEIDHSERAVRVLAGLIDFAHSLGASVVAKGIETQTQMRILRRLGCDLLQGKAVGAPAREPQFVAIDG